MSRLRPARLDFRNDKLMLLVGSLVGSFFWVNTYCTVTFQTTPAYHDSAEENTVADWREDPSNHFKEILIFYPCAPQKL